jgi:HEAT repeat protein
MYFALAIALLLGVTVSLFGQAAQPAANERVDKLIAVLKSDAPQKAKADACRELAIIGTKDAIAPLAALLSDEKLSHNARYALEPIADPAVDEVLRDALGKLKGRPLAGVIGSIGIRRDGKAVELLAGLLADGDADVSQAAARALGRIGNPPAAKALQDVLPNAPAANQLAVCEGLFRCAEALSASGQRDQAIAIYDRLLSVQGLHQVRTGALRGAILTRQKEGLPLLQKNLRSDDRILFAAAVQTSGALAGDEVTKALMDALAGQSADNQILIIQALGKRAQVGALPVLFGLAESGEKPVRVAAIRALPEIGNAASSQLLMKLLSDGDREISQAAKESLAALPSRQVDEAVMGMLDSAKTDDRLTALELIGRRRMTTGVPALLKATGDADVKVRTAAIRMVGELGGAGDLPAMLDVLLKLKESQDLTAAEEALIALAGKTDNPQSHAGKLTSLLAAAQPAQKIALLRVLGATGGNDALSAVRAAVNDSDAQVQSAAIRALCTWRNADAAPDLLTLARSAGNPNDRTLCLRGYLGLAARGDLPADQRLSMCKQAVDLIQRDEEKKLLLATLGSIDSLDAVALVMPYLDDQANRQEACMACLAIVEQILKGPDGSKLAAKLVEPLEKAAQVAPNADLAQRAKGLLRQVKKRTGAEK